MTSLDDLFREAMSLSRTWDHGDVRSTLEALARRELRVDWEAGDEEWGRLVDASGNVHALVCVRVPACIVLRDVDVRRLVERVPCMTVVSMSDSVFGVDRVLLEKIFDRTLSTNLNYTSLSIDDLWWATVS